MNRNSVAVSHLAKGAANRAVPVPSVLHIIPFICHLLALTRATRGAMAYRAKRARHTSWRAWIRRAPSGSAIGPERRGIKVQESREMRIIKAAYSEETSAV